MSGPPLPNFWKLHPMSFFYLGSRFLAPYLAAQTYYPLDIKPLISASHRHCLVIDTTSSNFISTTTLQLLPGLSPTPPTFMMEPTSYRKHLLQNLFLLSLSFLLLPLTTPVCWFLYLRFCRSTSSRPLPCTPSYAGHGRKTLLITSPYMTKSLYLIRKLSRAGHRIITVSTGRIPTSGSVSRHASASYCIHPPASPTNCKDYSTALLDIVLKENIDGWIPVSSVISAVADAEAASLIRTRVPSFRALIPSPTIVATLDDKASFITACQNLGLDVPETVTISDIELMVDFLHEPSRTTGNCSKRYIIKCTSTHDAARGDLTTLPLGRRELTRSFLEKKLGQCGGKLDWVLQEFIASPAREYATHCIVTQGRIRSFVVVEGGEMVMLYRAVKETELVREMRRWTEGLIEGMGIKEGQVSMDFLIEETGVGLDRRVVGIECNPRTHTAVVTMKEEAIVRGCLGIFDDDATKESENKRADGRISRKRSANGRASGCEKEKMTTRGQGHDNLVAERPEIGSNYGIHVDGKVKEKEEVHDALEGEKWWIAHELLTNPLGVFTGKDAEFDPSDPLPWWWAYHVWWPAVFITSLVLGKRWTRINVSTGKVFQSA